MISHMCIDTTVRAAKDLGYEVDLVADACDTKDLELNGEVLKAELVHKVFIAALSGAFANIL